MLSICIALYIYKYMYIQDIEFKELVSARMLGANDKDFFLELIWNAQNSSYTAFKIDIAELFFYEFEEVIARVFLDDTVYINPFTASVFVVNATLNRETYERLIYNFIDAYAFNLIGTAKAKTLFFSKNLRIDKHIPINIKDIYCAFLSESFKNSILVENIDLIGRQNNLYIDCNITIFNRTGFDLYISDFEGNIYLSRVGNGVSTHFEPIRFIDNETTNTSSMSFVLDTHIPNDTAYHRYLIEGTMTAVFWDTEFKFPIEIIGEL